MSASNICAFSPLYCHNQYVLANINYLICIRHSLLQVIYILFPHLILTTTQYSYIAISSLLQMLRDLPKVIYWVLEPGIELRSSDSRAIMKSLLHRKKSPTKTGIFCMFKMAYTVQRQTRSSVKLSGIQFEIFVEKLEFIKLE